MSSIFTFTVSDSIAASNISGVAMLITAGASSNTANACYLVYNPASSTISLYNDMKTISKLEALRPPRRRWNSQVRRGLHGRVSIGELGPVQRRCGL